MSSTREKIVAEWSKGNKDDGEWVDSDDPVTLHKPHQRIDYKSGIEGYQRGERGCWCHCCGAKVTLGPDLVNEYGHYAECEFRNIEREPNNLKGEL